LIGSEIEVRGTQTHRQHGGIVSLKKKWTENGIDINERLTSLMGI
jgi:hypothetical protein